MLTWQMMNDSVKTSVRQNLTGRRRNAGCTTLNGRTDDQDKQSQLDVNGEDGDKVIENEKFYTGTA